MEQAAALTDLQGKPLIVVTADTGNDAAWQAPQQQLTTLSTHSLQRVAHATYQTLVADQAASATAPITPPAPCPVRTWWWRWRGRPWLPTPPSSAYSA